MEWVWQSNHLTDSYTYSVHGFTDRQLNIPYSFSIIQSVTTTLLNYSIKPLYLKSSLQYAITSEYPEANIECNDFMTSSSKAIQIITKSKWLS